MALGKLGQLFGFEDDDDYEDEDYLEDGEDEIEAIKPAFAQNSKNKTLTLNSGKMPDFVFAQPKRFDECFTISDKIKEHNVVVINFDGVSQPIAHRLVDFFSGVAYACDSKIKQISKDTHAIIPSACTYNDITEILENVLD